LLEQAYLTLTAFSLAGFTLKMADLWGEKGRWLGYPASAASAILFWLLLKLSASTSTIALSIIVGNLAAGKVDRPNLYLGLAIILLLALTLGFSTPHLPSLAVLSTLAFLDELIHERGGFLSFRPSLKAGVIVLAFLGWLTLIAALGLLLFDFAYEVWGRWRPA